MGATKATLGTTLRRHFVPCFVAVGGFGPAVAEFAGWLNVLVREYGHTEWRGRVSSHTRDVNAKCQ